MILTGLNGFKELQPNNLVGDLLSYMEDRLPVFVRSQEFADILAKKKNENQHSLSLCAYLTNSCQSKFYFARENSQAGSSVIDIGVYSGSILIFTIEAKLLPIPQGRKKNKRAEHEYVYGTGAGIQRFKDGKHGTDNVDNLLAENGLVAFLKEGDFEFWLQKINQWIGDANWGNSEMVEKMYFNSIGRLKSVHKRSNDIDVLLHHFWINVAQS